MSKERLEEIKKRLVLLHNAIDVDDETKNYIFKDLKVEWLIERVQELEELLIQEKYDKNLFNARTEEWIKMKQQNKRYREALEEIMKIQENHEWNLYGLAYGIAERTLFELEGEE